VCEYPDGTKSLKLGDFGLATVVEGPLYTVCGTPTYVAPEIIAETGYGLKVDIWAAGVITYILLCGFPPFRSENNLQEDLFDQILAGKLEFPAPYWDKHHGLCQVHPMVWSLKFLAKFLKLDWPSFRFPSILLCSSKL
ncbi:serine/threonine-protein kinase DCLK2-like, partial [Rhinopithecus roxellana]|uniref:serine/threonine-protein kinase DCLK2-like n=1 Tax=Rhinopithecus roxellana TaxID=61622 RepID=UPI00123783AB